MSNLTSSASASITHYSNRAPTYDEGNGGWHIGLGLDYVNKYLAPIAPGSICLDLACGTGLVSIPLAEAAGPEGRVIAVDVTKAMLDEGRKKEAKEGSARISWYEGDIMDLSAIEEIQEVVRERGGFDVISCCSALVLLEDPQAAVTAWAKMLKKGGRGGMLIVDTPTEEKTLLHLFTQEMRQAATTVEGERLPDEFNWQWIKGKESLEDMFGKAGLVVERTWTTKSAEEKVYGQGEVDEVFDEQLKRYKDFIKASNLEELRGIFREHWKQNLSEDGTYKDQARLYVTLGRRP